MKTGSVLFLDKPGPQIAGKYEILARLRDGGMGSIYKVRHRLLDEIRVIKVMHPYAAADEDLKSRFLQEAKTATRLKHPNIATIYDFALDDDGTAYLVLEYIEGITLADLLESGRPPSVPLSLEIAHQSLLALGYLHHKNVIHRDISPDNLMLTHDERDRPLVKLIDLGIAKALDKPGPMTSTGIFLGKVKYASPEQFGNLSRGEKLDGRSDLYSLGIVLYEILTGEHPFEGETPTEFMRAHVFQPPIPFAETDPEGKIPQEVRAIVARALEKKREDRFASADAFDEEIVALQARLSSPESLKGTQALLSRFQTLPAPPESQVSTSDQDRLNQRFAARSTPTPSPTEAPTEVRTIVRRREPKAPGHRAQSRSRWPIVAAAAVGAVLLAAAIVWSRASRPEGLRIRSLARPAATAIVKTQVESASAATRLEGPAPTPAPDLAAPGSAISYRIVENKPPTVTAVPVRANVGMVRSRSYGEEARKPPEEPTVPTLSPRIAQPVNTPPPVDRISLPEPTAPAIESARRAAPQPEATAPSVISETEKIRQILQEYQQAMNTLDADLYVRTFPSLAGERRRRLENSWRSLRSQHIELDVLRIDLAGDRARVRARQSAVAVPLIGIEQRDARECVFSLEKRSNSWVIAAVN